MLYDPQGVAINFVKNDDIKILRDIEQYYSTQIDEVRLLFWCLFRVISAMRLTCWSDVEQLLLHPDFRSMRCALGCKHACLGCLGPGSGLSLGTRSVGCTLLPQAPLLVQ